MSDPEPRGIAVFFYGLFMDDSLLRSKGVTSPDGRRASVQGFSLVIGARAALVPALCFNLPWPPSPDERNADYAAKLTRLAERIGLPPDYVSSITP